MGLDREPMSDTTYGSGPAPTQWQQWQASRQSAQWETDSRAQNVPINNPAMRYSPESANWSQNTPLVKKTAPSNTAMAKAKTAPSTVASKSSKADDSQVKQVSYDESKSDSRTASTKPIPISLGMLQLFNSKRIAFNYEVKDPASTGVAGIELWGTTDSHTWKRYDIVSRTAHSVMVDVKDEGLYGFTMIARGKNDTAKNQPPQPGEAPQIWVAVDMTKPVVQVLGAELNVAASRPSLVVRWSAKDPHMGPRPVSLFYADRPEGPWLPIAANVENNGRYEWNMPSWVPATVYIRVQATDMMGNVGTAQTTTLHLPGRSASGNSSARLESIPATLPPLGQLPPAPTVFESKPMASLRSAEAE
jgi:hypothetical protein